MIKLQKDIGVGIGLILLSAVGYFILIPKGVDIPSSTDSIFISPEFWPSVIIGGIVVLGVFIVIEGIVANLKHQTRVPEAEAVINGQSSQLGRFLARLLFISLILVINAVWIVEVGIVMTNMVSIIVLNIGGGERRWLLNLSIALLTPSLIYLFFVYVAGIPMPLGILENIF